VPSVHRCLYATMSPLGSFSESGYIKLLSPSCCEFSCGLSAGYYRFEAVMTVIYRLLIALTRPGTVDEMRMHVLFIWCRNRMGRKTARGHPVGLGKEDGAANCKERDRPCDLIEVEQDTALHSFLHGVHCRGSVRAVLSGKFSELSGFVSSPKSGHFAYRTVTSTVEETSEIVKNRRFLGLQGDKS
jgi:hypothetical protein